MGLDIESWTEGEQEEVEEKLKLLITLNDLDPETVVNAVKREKNIEIANKEGYGGRPSKVEKHKKNILQVLNSDTENVSSDTVRDELESRIDNAVQDLSHQTELDLRRELEAEFGLGFSQPFESFKAENGDYQRILDLTRE